MRRLIDLLGSEETRGPGGGSLGLVLGLALLVPARVGAQITFAATPPTGLQAAYAMSTPTDASGNGRTATFANMTTAVGQYAEAQHFNATDSRMTVPTFQPTSAFTLEAWVYLDAPTVRQTRAVADPRGAPTSWQAIIYKGSDNFFLAEIGGFFTCGFTGPAGVVQLLNPTATPTNSWHHVAAVYDGAALRLYIDGANTATQAATGPLVASTEPIEVGGSAVDGGYLGGRVDDVRLYTRALSAAEITTDRATPVDTVREAVVSWDMEVWAKGNLPENGQASAVANFPRSGAACNLLPLPPPQGTPANPTKARLTDPDLPTRECELIIQTFIQTLKVGLGYTSTLKAKGATTTSDRSGVSNAFDRVAETTAPLPAGPPAVR